MIVDYNKAFVSLCIKSKLQRTSVSTYSLEVVLHQAMNAHYFAASASQHLKPSRAVKIPLAPLLQFVMAKITLII